MKLNNTYKVWVSKRVMLTKKILYLKEINLIVRAVVFENMTTFISADTVQFEELTQENIVRRDNVTSSRATYPGGWTTSG